MNRLEALSIAGALGVGSIVGFTGARTGFADWVRGGGRATQVEVSTAGTSSLTGTGNSTTLVGLDPLQVILEEPLRSRRLVALDQYCAGLDLAAVRRAAARLPDDHAPHAAEWRARLLGRWTELAPEEAAAFALGRKTTDSRQGALLDVLPVWLARDAGAAKQFVAGLKDKEVLGQIVYYFAAEIAQRDFEETIRFAATVPAAQQDEAVWAAFRIEGERNPTTAAARALTMPDGKQRENAIESAVTIWLDHDPQAAMAWVMQRPQTAVSFGQNLLQNAVQRWSGDDPEAAARFVQDLPATKERDALIRTVASSWGRSDTQGAMDWMQTLPDSPVKVQAMRGIVGRWSYDDPAAAAAFLATQPADNDRASMLANIGRNWASNDPAGALAWAAAQQDPALEKGVAAAALGALAADDPTAAVAALDSLHTAEGRAAAITAISRTWASRDAEEAARWVLALPEADASSAALQAVVTQGTQRDPAGMAQWLESLKDNPHRDTAVETFARSAQYYDAPTAATWANTLADADTRRPLVQNIVRQFANFDPAAARTWVLSQKFDATERQALLDQVDQATKRK